MNDLHSLSAYQYNLPQDLIAQHPCSPRDRSRLMVVDRRTGNFHEMIFRDIANFLQPGDSLVFNDTKVIPARLLGTRRGGGAAEIFLVRMIGEDVWEVLAKPGRKLDAGSQVTFGEDFYCEIEEVLPGGGRKARFYYGGLFEDVLNKYGRMPLPQYIKRKDIQDDKERYQTIFATHPGAVAAPTAGLHFTQELLQRLADKQVAQTRITLHVGLGTFRPVQAADIRQHKMHAEHFLITRDAADRLNGRAEDQRQICVGTTCCRALESSAQTDGRIVPGDHETNIFIYPGYRFKYVRSLLTNFHLPCSSLLMLVSAFAGHDLIMEAYRKAIKDRYRFYSYGDAMLIL